MVAIETFSRNGKMMKMQKIMKNVSRQKFYRQRRLIFLLDLTHASMKISLFLFLYFSLTLSVLLFLTHPHKRLNMNTGAHTHPHLNIRSYFHSSTHVIWNKHINMHTLTYSRTLSLSLSFSLF